MIIKTKLGICLRMLVWLLIPVFLATSTSCSKKGTEYPEPVNKAIDLFFAENKNDSVLLLLDYPAFLQKENSNLTDLKKIFSAAALCEKGYPDSAFTLFNSIKTTIKEDKLYYYYQSINGLIEFRRNNLRSAYEKLLYINNNKTQDTRALALNERTIGRIMQSFTDYKDAINWFLLSREHFEEAGLEKSVAVNDKFLGSCCNKLQLFNEAKIYLTSAENTFLKYNDKDELFYVHIVQTDHFLQQNQLDSAALYAQKALEVVDFEQDLKMKSHVLNNLGEIDMLRTNYQAALDNFNNTISLGDKYYSAPRRLQFAYLSKGRIYNIIDQPQQAEENLNIALGLLNATQDRTRFEVYKELAKIYALNNRTKTIEMLDSSLYYAKKYYSSQSGNVIKSFETQIELEKVKNSMEVMNQRAKRNQILAAMGTLLLLTIIFSLYRTSKIRNEKNIILKDLVKKNLRLLEEERKLSQAMRETNICMKKSKRTPTEDERSKIIYGELIDWLETDDNFLRNDITLETVAKEIGTNRDYLSRSISDHDTRFPELINKYRVKEAIGIMTNKADIRNKYSLQTISTEVGFNSHSTFIDAFKKQTSMTPVQFREQMLEMS